MKQVLGDDAGARAAYETVIAAGPGNPFASAARLNRAKLDIDAGASRPSLGRVRRIAARRIRATPRRG